MVVYTTMKANHRLKFCDVIRNNLVQSSTAQLLFSPIIFKPTVEYMHVVEILLHPGKFPFLHYLVCIEISL